MTATTAKWRRGAPGLAIALALTACQVPPPEPRELSAAHVGTAEPEPAPATTSPIPAPVTRTPFVPEPRPAVAVETYTVVVNEVPVKELLFALARDADLNVDVHPAIDGLVTLNAVDQTLNQILDRIARQVDLRYDTEGETLVIGPDTPTVRFYRVDYVNISRDTATGVQVSTQIETTDEGGGGTVSNTSTTAIRGESNYRLWETITSTVRAMIIGDRAVGADTADDPDPDEIVIPNRETGILVVRATERQHERVQAYLDRVLGAAKRQVLIEATVVEVELTDRYRAGIDWQKFVTGAGIGLNQSLIAGGPAAALAAAPFFVLTYSDADGTGTNTTRDLSLTVRLLKEFGNARVLSSPKLMVLNNHTATLKAVDNRVFFDIDTEVVQTPLAGGGVISSLAIDSEIRTVPEGFVMAVTPQIGDDDEITVNVRPTISRVFATVADPAIQPVPDGGGAGGTITPTPNNVPEVRVREMESMLRLNSGQIAVLGGLMQDNLSESTDGVPVLSDVDELGETFKSRDNNFVKTELVIFLRPWVVRTPSIEADLSSFRRYLPENLPRAEPLPPPNRIE